MTSWPIKSRSKSPTSVTDQKVLHISKRVDNELRIKTSMHSPPTKNRRSRASLLLPMSNNLFVVFLTIVGLGLCLSVWTISHSSNLYHSIPSSFQTLLHSMPQQRKPQDPHHNVYDVVIVGAGWSGLSAASRLYGLGIRNFVLLEGRETIGGRSRTKYPFSSAPNLAVEIGSAWTYENTEPHEMMLAQEQPHGQVHYDDPSTLGLYDRHGGEITGKQRQHYQHLWKDFCDYSHKIAEHLEDTKQDKPYQLILDSYIQQKHHKKHHHQPLRDDEIQFLQSMVHAQIEIEYAATITDVSAQTVGGAVDDKCVFCDANYYVPVDGGGFDKLLRPLAQPFQDKIRLNHKVIQVEYPSQELAKITYTDEHGIQQSKWAKTVLMTVPLGILKRQTIDFVPPLPQIKLNAIESVGWGVLNKCILYWDQDQSNWWPKGKEVLTLANGNGNFTTMFNDMELGNGDHYVLSAWIAGETAKQMEQEPDSVIVAKAMENLRAMMNRPNLPEPTQYVISRWGQDEFAYGSYSYHQNGREGLHRAARKELGARTGSSLFWAGEATHRSWPGTTVGAYRSGQDVVDEILLALEIDGGGGAVDPRLLR